MSNCRKYVGLCDETFFEKSKLSGCLDVLVGSSVSSQ